MKQLWRIRLAGLWAVVALAAVVAPTASPAKELHAGASIGAPLQPGGAEAQDAAVVYNAMQSFNSVSSGGLKQVEPLLVALKGVLAHAPSSYPMIYRRPGELIIRANDADQFAKLSASAPAGADAVRQAVNVYPLAALMLGSYANEMRRFDEAIGYLDQGLKLQPANAMLVSEKGAALVGEGRLADAVAMYGAALASAEPALVQARGRFLRARGVALIDLGRTDEAEQSLKASIDADPTDTVGITRARQELVYIERMRSGGRPTGIVLETRQDLAAEAQQQAQPAGKPPK